MSLTDDFEYFGKLIALAKRVHDTSRVPFGAGTCEGHFVNQNTVIRIAEAADEVREAVPEGAKDWYSSNDPDSICYVVLSVYRNCILHNRGKMQSDFDKKLKDRKSEYEKLCRDMDMQPHECGDKIQLPAQPMIRDLLLGLERFVGKQVRGRESRQT